MDYEGITAALATLLLFPGGVYVMVIAYSARRCTRISSERKEWSAAAYMSVACACVGAAGVALPGSPALAWHGGGLETVPLTLMVIAIGVVVVQHKWAIARLVAAISAGVSVALLCFSAGTVETVGVVAASASGALLPPLFVCVTILVALPIILHSDNRHTQAMGPACLLASGALFAISLIAARFSSTPGIVVDAVVGIAVCIYTVGVLFLVEKLPHRTWGPVSNFAAVVACASTVAVGAALHPWTA